MIREEVSMLNGFPEDPMPYGSDPVALFLKTLSPGTGIMLQFDSQPSACGIFEGFSGGLVLVSGYNGFSGLMRIRPDRIIAVAVVGSANRKLCENGPG
jgi:hypothetical protein